MTATVLFASILLTVSFSNLFGQIIFGSVGMVAFVYGKKQSSLKAIGFGCVLMAYPYFIQNTLALYGVGATLTAGFIYTAFHD